MPGAGRAYPGLMQWLIVSADPDLRGYLRDCLEPLASGVEVLEATDGIEAFIQVGAGAVELIVADLGQPRINGLELARALAGLPVRVLLLSAELDPEEAAAAGAGGVLSMPFTRRELGRRVAELVATGRESTRPAAVPRVAVNGSS